MKSSSGESTVPDSHSPPTELGGSPPLPPESQPTIRKQKLATHSRVTKKFVGTVGFSLMREEVWLIGPVEGTSQLMCLIPRSVTVPASATAKTDIICRSGRDKSPPHSNRLRAPRMSPVASPTRRFSPLAPRLSILAPTPHAKTRRNPARPTVAPGAPCVR